MRRHRCSSDQGRGRAAQAGADHCGGQGDALEKLCQGKTGSICHGDLLVNCTYTDGGLVVTSTSCALGCVVTSGAGTCRQLVPSNISPDLLKKGAGDLIVTNGTVTIDTSTGAIVGVTATPVLSYVSQKSGAPTLTVLVFKRIRIWARVW